MSGLVTPKAENVLGYTVDARGRESCVADLVNWIAFGDGLRWLACLNPHSYVIALEDCAFAAALRDADWLIPDGVGIVLASRWNNGQIRARVTGSDVFWSVHERLNERGNHKVFFLGSTEQTLARVRARMARDFPNVSVVGSYSPPFKDMYSPGELDEMVSAVNCAAPDVVWVGMTAPKQEKWIFENRGRLNARFVAAVGAVFDFYTGRVRRSHPAFQKAGLEWLPRLLQEPRRLWRRMFVSAPVFLWHAFRYRFR